MTDQRDDKRFEAFLAGESELTDRYAQLGREEPPPELDAQILAEAREAAKIHRTEFGPRGGWLKPLALAATVLLSFSLVMNIVVETPTRFEQIETKAKDDAAGTGTERSVTEQRFRDQREMPGAPSARAVEEALVAARKHSPAAPQALADRQAEAPADEPPAVPAMSPRSERPPERVMQTANQPVDRDTALSFVAEYFEAADKGRDEADVMVDSLAQKAGEEGPVPATPGESVMAGRTAVSVPESPRAEDAGEDPETLLREILRLYTAGEAIEAGELLDVFLARYPDHPVSVNIRQQGYRS